MYILYIIFIYIYIYVCILFRKDLYMIENSHRTICMRCPRPPCFSNSTRFIRRRPIHSRPALHPEAFRSMHPGPAKWRNGQLNYRSSRSSFRKVIMQCYDITLFMDHSPKRYVIQPLVTLNTMGGKPVQRGSNLVQG